MSAHNNSISRSNVPILIVSDSPNVPSGLGRITRDLAVRMAAMLPSVTDSIELQLPLFRVGTLGLGGGYTRELPFAQYQMISSQGSLVPNNFPEVWADFTSGSTERGIVFAIGNPTWLIWLSHPDSLPKDSALRALLESGPDGKRPFDCWLYAPIDGDGPGGRLPGEMVEALTGWDRVLAYNNYGARLIESALHGSDAAKFSELADSQEVLPHGIDTDEFYPRPRAEARRTFLQRVAGAGQPNSPFTADAQIDDDMLLIGVVATNSERKDWYLAMETCHALLEQGQNVVLWGHTNVAWRHWNLPALARDFGLGHRLALTTRSLTNDQLAWAYSACDVTLGIGSGEGWGFPLAESLACGVPVLHSNYAGGADFVPHHMLIDPVAYRGEGFYGIRRPVHRGRIWAAMVMHHRSWPVSLPAYIDWKNAWQGWSEWLRKGVT